MTGDSGRNETIDYASGRGGRHRGVPGRPLLIYSLTLLAIPVVLFGGGLLAQLLAPFVPKWLNTAAQVGSLYLLVAYAVTIPGWAAGVVWWLVQSFRRSGVSGGMQFWTTVALVAYLGLTIWACSGLASSLTRGSDLH
jgi:hypothetical protein